METNPSIIIFSIDFLNSIYFINRFIKEKFGLDFSKGPRKYVCLWSNKTLARHWCYCTILVYNVHCAVHSQAHTLIQADVAPRQVKLLFISAKDQIFVNFLPILLQFLFASFCLPPIIICIALIIHKHTHQVGSSKCTSLQCVCVCVWK